MKNKFVSLVLGVLFSVKLMSKKTFMTVMALGVLGLATAPALFFYSSPKQVVAQKAKEVKKVSMKKKVVKVVRTNKPKDNDSSFAIIDAGSDK